MKKFRQFTGDDKGATIIEFAFIAPIFLVLLFAILEFCILLHLRSSIEALTHQVARQAVTGSTYGKAGDRNAILMDNLQNSIGNILFNRENLNIDSEVYENFVTIQSGFESDRTNNEFGRANQIVRYRITYDHDYLTPIGFFVNLGQGITITSTVFAKNEDF